MSVNWRNISLFAALFVALGMVWTFQSPTLALTIVNMGLISAIMALGVNMQWGYAGIFNVGIMGFTAVGGLAAVLISMPPVGAAWSAGAFGAILGLMIGAATIFAAVLVTRRMVPGWPRMLTLIAVLGVGWTLNRAVFVPAINAIEAVNPASEGYLGGLGLPVLLAWPVGALLAAGAAWMVGKIALGLRSDYLAIATLGISEILISVLRNETWLARGVKNVTGIPRPLPGPAEVRQQDWLPGLADTLGWSVNQTAQVVVQLGYATLFLIVLGLLIWLAEKALNSPWGRMMRAIRDNETAARAMGKDVTKRHLGIFVLGSATCGLAGAMMVTLDGQLVPTAYEPLRFTFLIWVMVIVGGSGNNWGSVLGGILIWFLWVQVEPAGRWLIDVATIWLGEDSALRAHLLGNAAHMRLLTMGLAMLLVLRFSPRGLIPER
ncbi:branched-chain amino acid ABC transporter permease [Rhodobaculum claviforme]|uniref:Branched-chain amino acid ABC transporter permease n=1 Tax=Rhodobaculum claviforme TaxID=1549854 RepID=A0A934WJV7_9RHOB|nr:branched-chain amino acid ABC transporter permease [Rhodobaculum claviforme]MBK5927913.1 branched-chain amino acid ABC transporter permease [Rhodobaculum claviforme]